MPICIECRYPVPQLYYGPSSSRQHHQAPRPLGAADGSSTGGVGAAAAAAAAALEPSRGGGEASRPSAGSSVDVRLTQCPRCKRFADKYVEHDFVVLFIDLVLVKPQVYRHLLFNRLGNEEDRIDPSILRLGTLLLLFDVYLTWSAIEALPAVSTSASPIPALPILAQYAFYLLCCALATLAQHLTIRILARWTRLHRTVGVGAAPSVYAQHHKNPSASVVTPGAVASPHHSASSTNLAHAATFPLQGSFNASSTSHSHPNLASFANASYFSPLPATTAGSASASAGAAQQAQAHSQHSQWPSQPGPNAISTAIFVSSCMQLFPILMVVWKYDDTGGQLARGVSWAVGAQNVEALRILLGCGYGTAGALVGAGALARWFAKRAVLGMVGLAGLGV